MATRKFRVVDPIVIREVREYEVEVDEDEIAEVGAYEAVLNAISEFDGEMTVSSQDILYEYDEGVDFEEVK